MTHIIIIFHFLCITIGAVLQIDIIRRVQLRGTVLYLFLSQFCFCLFFILDTIKIYIKHLVKGIALTDLLSHINSAIYIVAILLLCIYVMKEVKLEVHVPFLSKLLAGVAFLCTILLLLANWVEELRPIPWMCFLYVAVNIASFTFLNYAMSNHTTKVDLSIFTEREKEIIQYICEGKSNKEIAQALVVSQNTVRNHIYNIFKKAEVKNRIELINYVK